MLTLTAGQLLRTTSLNALDARVLLAHALNWRHVELITRADVVLDNLAIDTFRALEQRRLNGEPIAQLVGYREFFALEFKITPKVLIPRPETECLVEQALKAIQSIDSPQVLDLGTGSGAIAIAIARQRPDAVITATDCCGDALAVAAENAQRLLPTSRPGGAVCFVQGYWYDALPSPTAKEGKGQVKGQIAGDFHLIVSNPPYIAANDPHLAKGDLRFEPLIALTDDADGLSALYAVIHRANRWLKSGAHLWVEHGYHQSEAVCTLLSAHGFSAVRSLCDLAGIKRISGGIFMPPIHGR